MQYIGTSSGDVSGPEVVAGSTLVYEFDAEFGEVLEVGFHDTVDPAVEVLDAVGVWCHSDFQGACSL